MSISILADSIRVIAADEWERYLKIEIDGEEVAFLECREGEECHRGTYLSLIGNRSFTHAELLRVESAISNDIEGPSAS